MHWIFVGPVGQLHHIILVGTVSFACPRLNNQGAIHPGHLLKAGVTVVPIGAALAEGKAVNKGFSRCDAWVADPRHTIHLIGQQDAVPVNRGRNR